MEKTDIDHLYEKAQELDNEIIVLMQRIEAAKNRIHNWELEIELNKRKVERIYDRLMHMYK